MIYSEKLAVGIELVNESLKNLGVQCLSENRDFCLSDEHHYFDYVKYSVQKIDSPRIEIEISNEVLQVNIEDMFEVFEWSLKGDLSSKKREIVNFFETLFSSDLEIEYCGKNYRKISIIDQKKNCVRSCKYVTGFFIKIKCFTKTFRAIYPKTNSTGTGLES